MILYFYEKFYDEEGAFTRMCLAAPPTIFLGMAAFKFVFLVKVINFHLENFIKLVTEIFDSPPIIENSNLNLIFVKSNKKRDFSIKLKALRRIYNLIYENCEVINRSMGKTVLTIVSVMVIAITASGYRLLLSFLGKLATDQVAGEHFRYQLLVS